MYLNNFCLLFSNQMERPDQGRDAPRKTIKIVKINNKDTFSKLQTKICAYLVKRSIITAVYGHRASGRGVFRAFQFSGYLIH